MKSLPVILCVLAIAGALCSAALYVRIGNSKQILQAQLTAANTRATSLSAKLAAATDQNEALEKRLTALDSDLGETKSRLTSSDAKNIQLSRELAQTKAQVAQHEQTALNLGGELAALNRQLADVRATSVPRDAVETYKITIAALERQLANAHDGAAAPATDGASTAVFASQGRAAPAAPPTTPPPAIATVVSVGPDSAFVVLDCGSANGAAKGQSFLIQRGTETLATVLISDVRPAFAVAQVQPDSLHGALHKGDSAILTP